MPRRDNRGNSCRMLIGGAFALLLAASGAARAEASGSLLVKGAEVPHFEGLLLWNGVRKNLDMLLALDLDRGRVQEQGVVSVEPDGRVVREITAFYSEGERPIGQPVAGAGGAKARFRQTFQAAGPDRIRTTVMRELGNGWVATFPGSDRLVMIRRSKA